ncbi:hypothetical protein [Solidesulfovibrio sp.]
MKTILTFLVVFLAAGSVAWADEQYDFRNTKWGMNKEEVKQSEELKPHEENESAILYLDKIDDLEVVVVYFFTEGKLTSAKYGALNKYVNNNSYYWQAFDPLREMLFKKYGKEVKRDKIWTNKLYQNNPSEIGMAIATGGYDEYVLWDTGKTKIIAFINGENFKIKTGIEYYSKEFEKSADDNKEKKKLKKL